MLARTSARLMVGAVLAVILVALGTAFGTLAEAREGGTPHDSPAVGFDLRLERDANGAERTARSAVDFGDDLVNLIPGDTVTKTLTVSHSGSGAASLGLLPPRIRNVAGTPAVALEDELLLAITNAETGVPLYSGPLSGAAFAGYDLAADDVDGIPIDIALTLPSTVPGEVAGQSIVFVLTFAATLH